MVQTIAPNKTTMPFPGSLTIESEVFPSYTQVKKIIMSESLKRNQYVEQITVFNIFEFQNENDFKSYQKVSI
jgi:hypothetical protein